MMYISRFIRYNDVNETHAKETTMKKKSTYQALFIGLLSCCLLLSGCNNDTTTAPSVSSETSSEQPSSDTEVAEESSMPSQPVTEAPVEEKKSLTISVVNMCGIEIGMVSVIDPATGEQVNLDSLSTGESISMEANWPSDVKEFQWALYNTNGELCIESKTDISQATTSATLVLTGDGNLENVEELFE